MTLKNPIIIKNKLLVNISGNSTLVQRKLFNTFLYKVFDKLGDYNQRYFSFSVKEIKILMGYQGKMSIKQLKNDCKALASTIITWNILEKDGEIDEFEISTILSSARLKNGQITIQFPDILREKIVENKQYIKLNLSLQNKFTSKYSLVLYELCKEFYREKEEKGESPWIQLEKLRFLLGLEQTEYTQFKLFRFHVLDKAIKEINKVSDIIISTEYKKQSRKVSEIKINMVKNPENQNLGIPKKSDLFVENKANLILPVKNSLLSQTSTFGISDTLCSSWLISYSPEYIQSKIDLTYSYIKQKKIKTSPSGFLIRAIAEDFGGKITDIDSLLSQEALEARKINPETFSISPTDYSSEEEFEARIIDLESQYYNPRWSEMDMNIAKELWKLQKVTA
jgi:plasmid replication initiation protein